jgi:hypothetical protein
MMMDDEILESKKSSNYNYWFSIVGFILVAAFVPERYSILVFLGGIWVILFEISDRLRVQYYFHKRNAESLEKLVER